MAVVENHSQVAAIAARAQVQSSTLHSINALVASIDRQTRKNASNGRGDCFSGAQLAFDGGALTSLLTEFRIEVKTVDVVNSDGDEVLLVPRRIPR